MSEVLQALEAAKAAILGGAPADAATEDPAPAVLEAAPEPATETESDATTTPPDADAPPRRAAMLAPAARYSAAEIARANALVLAAPAARAALGPLTVALAGPEPLLPAEAPATQARVMLGGVALTLDLGWRTTETLADLTRAPDVDALLADPPLAALALEAAAAPLLDRIERAAGVRIEIQDWRVAASEPTPPEPGEDLLQWAVNGLDRAPERATLRGERAVLDLALEHLSRAAEASRRGAEEAEGALFLPAALRLPTTRLTLGELSRLAPGDVVLDGFDRRDLRLCVISRRWRAALEEEVRVSIEDLADPAETAAEAETADLNSVGDAAAELADAELNVSFELARTSLPLSTARRLAPGYVFSLDRAVTSEVDIIVSNRRFGRGRLVEIDGEIGVEIVRIG